MDLDENLDHILLILDQPPKSPFLDLPHPNRRCNHLLGSDPPLIDLLQHLPKSLVVESRHAHVRPFPEHHVVHVQRGPVLPYRDVDHGPPRADAFQGFVETDLDTGRVKGDVDAGVVREGVHGGEQVGGERVDDVVGAELKGELRTASRGLGDDYERRRGLGGGLREDGLDYGEADRAAAEDEDGHAGGDGVGERGGFDCVVAY